MSSTSSQVVSTQYFSPVLQYSMLFFWSLIAKSLLNPANDPTHWWWNRKIFKYSDNYENKRESQWALCFFRSKFASKAFRPEVKMQIFPPDLIPKAEVRFSSGKIQRIAQRATCSNKVTCFLFDSKETFWFITNKLLGFNWFLVRNSVWKPPNKRLLSFVDFVNPAQLTLFSAFAQQVLSLAQTIWRLLLEAQIRFTIFRRSLSGYSADKWGFGSRDPRDPSMTFNIQSRY